MQSGDRGFADLLTITFAAACPAVEELEERRASAYRDWVTIVHRAEAARRLRRDLHPDDLVVLLIANAGVVAATGGTAPEAWRRHVEYMLQAFAADHAEPLPAPAARDALLQAIRRTRAGS